MRKGADREPVDERVLVAIAEYQVERGYSPSLRDIAERAGLSSTSVVSGHLRQLRQRGLVRFEPGLVRTIRLTGEGLRLAYTSRGSRPRSG